MAATERPVVALVAAPNSGKTTLFNRLTGAHQHVGNWPGVTLQRKSGRTVIAGREVEVVDLPGAYALTPTSEEERVVRDFILTTPPDVLVNVLDARNLYRGLGLTLQLAASGIPLVVAVNMLDEARAQGLELDLDALSRHLGAPVVGIVARSGEGLDALRGRIAEALQRPRAAAGRAHVAFPEPVAEHVRALAREVTGECAPAPLAPEFVALELLEGAGEPALACAGGVRGERLTRAVASHRQALERSLGGDVESACANCRFAAARGLVLETTGTLPAASGRLTDWLDAVLLHPVAGLPLFLLTMLALFQGVFWLGTPLQDAVAAGVGALQGWLHASPAVGWLPGWAQGFLIDGLVNGVGVVVTFFPLIALFFMFMSIIEDSGYMARAAFLMDRLMHLLGLDGKAFINILLGFGCNVPAVMGTRVLASRYNRLLTMLVLPFSLCSARLQVFVFLASVLFAASVAPWVVFGLYVGSVAAIVVVGLALKALRIAGDPEPFVMELPPYRIPLARSVLLRAWHEMRGFLNRAATLIVGGVIGVWLLTNLPPGVVEGSRDSLAGQLGMWLEPVFAPIGIHWREAVTLVFGFIAKETVLGAMAVIYGADLEAAVGAAMTPLAGLSFMVFVLLYTPCVATLATIRSESGSWRYAALSVVVGLVLAWTASLLVYQGGRLLGF